MSDVDLPRRLEDYGAHFTKLALIRIGLAAGDLQSLPSFDPESKSQDPRFGWFQKSVGTLCYELDAVSPPDLRSRVEEEF